MTKLAALLRQMKVTNILLRARNGIQTGIFGSASRRKHDICRRRQSNSTSGSSDRLRADLGARSDSDGTVEARDLCKVPQGEEAKNPNWYECHTPGQSVSATVMTAERADATRRSEAQKSNSHAVQSAALVPQGCQTCATCEHFYDGRQNNGDPQCDDERDENLMGGRIVYATFGCIFHTPAPPLSPDPPQEK